MLHLLLLLSDDVKKRIEELKDQRPLKTLIAIMAVYDNEHANERLRDFLIEIYENYDKKIKEYGFVFTGGTYHRIITGKDENKRYMIKNKAIRDFYIERSVFLPRYQKGGNTLLANLVVQKKISIIWSFFYPLSSHSLSPENGVLMRLCDLWGVKRLLNRTAIKKWVEFESQFDTKRNLQPFPPAIILRRDGTADERESIEPALIPPKSKFMKLGWQIENEDETKNQENEDQNLQLYEEEDDAVEWTIAMIAYGEMKEKMVDLVRNFEREFRAFNRIITTNNLGTLLTNEIPGLKNNIYRYHSGLKGGFSEIATEVLFEKCKVIFLFPDPNDPLSYLDETKALIGTTMINERIRLITNDFQGRDWLEHIVRPKLLRELKTLYKSGDVCQVTATYKFIGHVETKLACHKESDNLIIKMQKGKRFPPFKQNDKPECGKPSYWYFIK